MSSAEAGTSVGGARGEAIGDSDAAMAGWRMSPRERRFLVWSSPLSYPTFPFISPLVLGRIHVRSSSDLLNCSEAHAGTDESRSAGNMSTAEAEERPAFGFLGSGKRSAAGEHELLSDGLFIEDDDVEGDRLGCLDVLKTPCSEFVELPFLSLFCKITTYFPLKKKGSC
jgi:hypothetical protein